MAKGSSGKNGKNGGGAVLGLQEMSSSDLEQRILQLLVQTPQPLTINTIARRLEQKEDYLVGKSLLALQERKLVKHVSGSHWQASETASKGFSPSSIPWHKINQGTNPQTISQSSSPNNQSSIKQIDFSSSRWADFRRLCQYYAECIRLGEWTRISEYTQDEGQKFFTINHKLNWRAISSNQPFEIFLNDDMTAFFRKFKTRKFAQKLSIGAPVNVYIGKDASTGNLYRIASPLFVMDLDYDLIGDSVCFHPVGDVQINHGWLESRFKNPKEKKFFLEICGLDFSDDEDEELGIKIVRPSCGFPELYTALKLHYKDDWKEFPNLDDIQSYPRLNDISESGLYNRAIIVSQAGLKYSGRLYSELIQLANKVADEDIDRTALQHLFSFQPPKQTNDFFNKESGKIQAEVLEDIAEFSVLNSSQIKACNFARNTNLSVVTGPPGTGKSHVVCHIMANATINKQTVLFASRNHKAIEAVVPKLNNLVEPNTLVVNLAKRFGQIGEDPYQAILNAILNRPKRPDILNEIKFDVLKLNSLFNKKRELNSTIQKISEIQELIADNLKSITDLLGADDAKNIWNCQHIPSGLEIEKYFDLYLGSGQTIKRFKNLFYILFGWYLRKKFLAPARQVIEKYAACFELLNEFRNCNQKQIRDAFAEIKPISQALENIKLITKYRNTLNKLPQLENCYNKLNSLTQEQNSSVLHLLSLITESYGAEISGQQRQKYAEIHAGLQAHGSDTTKAQSRKFLKALKDCFPELLKHARLWATVNLSVGKNLPLIPAAFDLLIIDEASQCDIASVIPLLYRAKRVMVVGDPMQLPHISSLARDTDWRLRNQYELTDTCFERYSFRVNSFFGLASSSGALGNDDQVQLTDHYRCHPAIADYCNAAFYSKTLKVMTDLFSNRKAFNRTGIDWTHIPEDIEHVSGSGAMSRGQINGIVSELKRLATEDFKGTVGVVSPFKIQANRIYDAVLQAFDSNPPEKWNFHVDTANGFQGDERDIILLSLVGGKSMPRGAEWFLKNETSSNLFNVAVSRAKIMLHIFGDKEWANSCEIPHIVKLVHAYDRYKTRQDYVFRSDLIGPVWEPLFAEALRSEKISFVQQYPVCGNRFYLDFAIINSSLKLNVEIDGEMFHRNAQGKRRIEDLQRDILLVSHGWKIKRFWVYELRENMDQCIQSIKEIIKQNT